MAAIVPHLLGFVPRDSIVLLFFDERGRLGLTLRTDTPRSGRLRGFSAALVRETHLEDAAAVHVSAFADDPSLVGSIASAVAADFSAAGLRVVGVGAVSAGAWWPVDADGVVAPSGESLLEGDALDVTARLVLAGRSYSADRSDLVASVREPEQGVQGEVAQHLERQRARMPRRGDKDHGRAWLSAAERRRVEDAAVEYLHGRRARPDPKELAAWAIAFRDSRVREPVLWRCSPASHEGADAGLADDVLADDVLADDVLARFALLVRSVPQSAVAPMAAALAAVAWQEGNGPMARIAAEYACECDPGNRLGRLVGTAVERGVAPDVWIDLMRSCTLRELRSRRS